jgi:hypothetical protein
MYRLAVTLAIFAALGIVVRAEGERNNSTTKTKQASTPASGQQTRPAQPAPAARPQQPQTQRLPQARTPGRMPARPYPNRGLNQNQLRQQPQLVDVTKTTDVDVTAAGDVKVRVPDAPVEYDSDGKVKTLTPEQRKKLKGDNPEDQKLFGYPGDFANLKVGDQVVVTLGVSKTRPKSLASVKDRDADSKKDKDADKKKDKDADKAKDKEAKDTKDQDADKSKEADKGKDADKEKPKTDREDEEYWVKSGQVSGTVVNLGGGSSRLVTVRVTYTVKVPVYPNQARTNVQTNDVTKNVIAPDKKQAIVIEIRSSQAQTTQADATPPRKKKNQ